MAAVAAGLEPFAMMRTKGMRLGVSDPADILRWAGAQSTRQLDDFRYRVIRGREFVSFRMVPRYAIEIGTNDIIVVAYLKARARRKLTAAAADLCRKTARRVGTTIAALKPPGMPPLPAHSAELYQLATVRVSSPFHR
jgi:hypothetical protein